MVPTSRIRRRRRWSAKSRCRTGEASRSRAATPTCRPADRSSCDRREHAIGAGRGRFRRHAGLRRRCRGVGRLRLRRGRLRGSAGDRRQRAVGASGGRLRRHAGRRRDVAVSGGYAYVRVATAYGPSRDRRERTVRAGRRWGSSTLLRATRAGVAVSGGYAYVADATRASGDRRERAVGAGRGGIRRHCRGATWSVAVSGGYAYVADSGCGSACDRREHAVGAGRGGIPRHAGLRRRCRGVGRLCLRRGRLCGSAGDRREHAVGAGRGGLRRHAGHAPSDVAVSGGYAYVAGLDGLRGDRREHAVGAGGGGFRRHAGRRPGTSWCRAGHAYVAWNCDPGRVVLRVIDVSAPSAPVEVGFVDTPGEAPRRRGVGRLRLRRRTTRGLR